MLAAAVMAALLAIVGRVRGRRGSGGVALVGSRYSCARGAWLGRRWLPLLLLWLLMLLLLLGVV